MSGSYRCVVFAIVGWLALCGAQQPAKQPNSPSSAEKTTKAPQPAPSETPPYRPYRDRYSDACYQAENHDTADLCAQWRAAVAAEKAADEARLATIAAIVGTVFSLITVGGLIVTIWQTNGALGEARRGNRLNLIFERRARREARKADADQARALEIAERNAQAAADQVAQFREAQRAWVRLDLVPHKIDTSHAGGLHFNLDVVAENVGQTVATHFELYAEVFFKGQEETVDDLYDRVAKQVEAWENEYSSGAMAALMPKDRNLELIRADFSGDEVAWWSGIGHGAGRAQVLVLGAVYYRTESKPDLLQVSWRSWYVSDGRGAKPMSFIDRNTVELRNRDIAVAPYSQSTVHEERPRRQQDCKN